ncbi:class B sortase, LPKTxAVK-specific [Streptococcus sp. ZJ93]|uniref:class B sortase, LPKTxAVK-specific n=1 Tax=Streptococcus handemini TaxID=3161188 RepID=UPI0032EE06DC
MKRGTRKKTSNSNKETKLLKYLLMALAFVVVAVGGVYATLALKSGVLQSTPSSSTPPSSSVTAPTYTVSEEEKQYLTERFNGLKATNPETVGYVYIPGTQLDEPIVQTGDNATYLDKTFEGNNEPLMGTVFMDTDNNKNFTDSLTWLFGHARGSAVPDHRMFNDVNFYDSQTYFDAHPYVVVETPERKRYYEAMFMIIVPETTAFYRTSFDSKADFKKQLTDVEKDAVTKSKNLKINENDNYLVLSTCREEDDTIRANLYVREIPDSELADFLAQHGSQLAYTPTR